MYSPGSFFAFGKQGKLQRDVARPSAHPGLGVQREFCFLVEDCEKFSWWSRPGDFRLNRLGIWRDSLSQGGFWGEIPPRDTQAPYHATKMLPHTKTNADVFPKSPGMCRGDGPRPLCGFGFCPKRKEDIRRCQTSHLLLLEIAQ